MEALNELALFAGAGGGILGGKLLGWRTRCAVEIDPYCQSVLLARQRDGLLDPFPIWDDVCTFDGQPWRGSIDVVSGGFPCQDISSAGKMLGIKHGKKSILWEQMARIICEVRPRFAFVENSPMLTSRGLEFVLGDLAALGYDAQWGVFSAAQAGAPHPRERLWVLGIDSHANGINEGDKAISKIRTRSADRKRNTWWASELCASRVARVADGVANRVDRAGAIGNGQVPAVAALAFSELYDRIERDQR